MAYINASVNDSSTIVLAPTEKIKDAAHTFVEVDDTGKLKKAAAGAAAIGVVLSPVEDDDNLYTVQIQNMGLVRAEEEVKIGFPLAVGAEGGAKKAGTGDFIMGYCTRGVAKGGLCEIHLSKSGYEK